MRQRDGDERAALARLHTGDSAAYLRWAGDSKRITVHTTSDAHARRSGTGARRATSTDPRKQC